MNLKELRKNSNLTQEEVAKMLNTNQVTYGRYELETSEPNIETLIKLADYYDVSLDYLVGRGYANDIGYLTPDQKEFLKIFLKLDEFDQAKVIGYASSFIQER